MSDLGLTRKAIHEARQLRDAEAAAPGVVRRTLDERLERGEEPTKAAVRGAVAEVINLDARRTPEPPPEREAEAAEADLSSVEGRAHAITGGSSAIDLVAINGQEMAALGVPVRNA